MTTETPAPARVVNFVTERPKGPSPKSLERAVAGSWIDAVTEAVRFARIVNHEVV